MRAETHIDNLTERRVRLSENPMTGETAAALVLGAPFDETLVIRGTRTDIDILLADWTEELDRSELVDGRQVRTVGGL